MTTSPTAPGSPTSPTAPGQATPAHNRPRSTQVTEGRDRAPARAMLRAVGFTDDDFSRPQVAVASSWNEVTPCNVHLDKLADAAKAGVRLAGGVPLEFNTIAVSDGISMGHEGMRASLVSREIIADSVELVMHAERLDGLVAIAGCDKSLPGMLMACARVNLPSAFLYGGTILPGHFHGRDITIQDVFEAVGANAAGAMSDADLDGIERHDGGPIGLVAEGDPIVLDVPGRRLDLLVDEAELARRRAALTHPAPRYTSGALAKYARVVAGAETGAVCG